MDRVKETIAVITKLILAVGTISFLIFELIPDAVIGLFGKNTKSKAIADLAIEKAKS